MWEPDNVRLLLSQVRLRRERRLRGPGTILLPTGTRVAADDIIGEYDTASHFSLVDVAQALGVAPRRVEALLKVQPGDTVRAGEPLAERGGFRRRPLAAPSDGTVLYLDELGRLLLRLAPERRSLRALIAGTIVEVTPGESCVIEATGALAQGRWGNGQSGSGLLRFLVTDAEASAPSALITAGQRGMVLVAGATVDEATLRAVGEVQAGGLIVGGLESHLLPLARSLPLPIMVTDGFGPRPINGPLFELLGLCDGRTVALMARAPEEHQRPELFTAYNAPDALPAPSAPLAVGDRVRLLGSRQSGQFGRIESLPQRATLPSELTAHACRVRLDDGTTLVSPLSNLERFISDGVG